MYSTVSWYVVVCIKVCILVCIGHVFGYVFRYVLVCSCMYKHILARIPEEWRAEAPERLAQDHQGRPR